MLEKVQKAKELYNLKKQADSMKKELATMRYDIEEQGVRVIMRGDNHIEELWLDGEEQPRISHTLNKAFKDVQKKVAKKMQGRLGDLGLPGF